MTSVISGAWMMRLPLLLLCLLAACMVVPPPIPPLAPEKKEHFYSADFTATWQAVIDVITDRELPIETVDKEGGIIITGFVFVNAEPPLFPRQADFATEGRYRLNILVMPVGHRTRVRINARFERVSRIYTPNPAAPRFELLWKQQPSVGILEAQLFADIQRSINEQHATEGQSP